MSAVVRHDRFIIHFNYDDVTSEDVENALKTVNEVFSGEKLKKNEFLVFEGLRGGFVRFVERVEIIAL